MPLNKKIEPNSIVIKEDNQQELKETPDEIKVGSTVIKNRFLNIRNNLLEKGRIDAEAAKYLGRAIEDTSLGLNIRVPKDLLDAKLIRFQDMNELSWLSNLFNVVLSLSACFLGALISSLVTSVSSSIIYLLIAICLVLASITIVVMLRKNKLMKMIYSEKNFISVLDANISIGPRK